MMRFYSYGSEEAQDDIPEMRPDKPNNESLLLAAYRRWVRRGFKPVKVDAELAIQHPDIIRN